MRAKGYSYFAASREMTKRKLQKKKKLARKKASVKHKNFLYEKQKGRCYYCKRKCTRKQHVDNSFTIDHVKPLSLGGYNKLKNLVGACYRCNQLKGSLNIGTFKQKLFETHGIKF